MAAGAGNKYAEKHGGESARLALQHGEELRGLAARAEAEDRRLYEASGVDPMLERSALRLQAAADCFWNAFLQAEESGDLVKMERMAARFGWLQRQANLTFMELRKNPGKPEMIDLSQYRAEERSGADDSQDS